MARKAAGERQTGSRMKYRPQVADRWAAYKQEDRGIQSDRLLTGRRKQTDRLSNRLQETDRQHTGRHAAGDKQTGSGLAGRPHVTGRQAEDRLQETARSRLEDRLREIDRPRNFRKAAGHRLADRSQKTDRQAAD
jgi:hypothetical protein